MIRLVMPLVLPCCSIAAFGQTDLAFPQIIVGESFETVVLISNNVAVADSVEFEVFSSNAPGVTNGSPLAVQFNGDSPAPSATRNLAPFEELSIQLSLADSNLRAGWLRVRSNAPGGKISGSLFYQVKQNGRILDSVGVTSAGRYRFAQVQLDNREQASATGLAFINPDETPVEVAIDLFRADTHLARALQQLAPHEHFAELVSEIFPEHPATLATLVIEASASRAIPILTLRIDGTQLTSLPVQPLGFSLQYEIRDEMQSLVETGYWVLDSAEFELLGVGRRTDVSSPETYPVTGTWFGTSFQCYHRLPLEDGTFGSVVFNGTSSDLEKSEGASILGWVTQLDSEGKLLSVQRFSAFAKY